MSETMTLGICALCGSRASRAAMPAHLRRCAPSHDRPTGPESPLYHVRVEGTGNPIFWLDLEVKAGAKLLQLDRFLRKTWLECCGHLSAFYIGGSIYSVVLDPEFEVMRNERSMNARVAEVLPERQRFRYEYDFGSTTELTLRVLGTRVGVTGRSVVRLLARNEPPVRPCAVCKEPATVVCAFCDDDADPFCCETHAAEHACGEEGFLPVVNSPRMGVCGYAGEG